MACERDSTELASMRAQLSSHKSVTDTLRAQTHEFSNQLHTISGVVGFTAILFAMAAYGVALGGQPGMRHLRLMGLTCAAIGAVLGGSARLRKPSGGSGRPRCGQPRTRVQESERRVTVTAHHGRDFGDLIDITQVGDRFQVDEQKAVVQADFRPGRRGFGQSVPQPGMSCAHVTGAK